MTPDQARALWEQAKTQQKAQEQAADYRYFNYVNGTPSSQTKKPGFKSSLDSFEDCGRVFDSSGELWIAPSAVKEYVPDLKVPGQMTLLCHGWKETRIVNKYKL